MWDRVPPFNCIFIRWQCRSPSICGLLRDRFVLIKQGQKWLVISLHDESMTIENERNLVTPTTQARASFSICEYFLSESLNVLETNTTSFSLLSGSSSFFWVASLLSIVSNTRRDWLQGRVDLNRPWGGLPSSGHWAKWSKMPCSLCNNWRFREVLWSRNHLYK